MAYYDDKRFDISKPMSEADLSITARNLDMIEKRRSHPQSDEEYRNARKINEEREASERRMNREREESERRITEEQERRARQEMELEAEREERRAERRAREEEESNRRQLEFEQEQMRRRMAVSYTEYDRDCELYYYYDERGDYIDSDEARRRWQKLHCESYTTYDPADTFWEFFLDGKGRVISRKEAFELWQPDHCPDYLKYDDRSIWTKYRCKGELISSSEARDRWLEECKDTDEVKAYHIKTQVIAVSDKIAEGMARLPKFPIDGSDEFNKFKDNWDLTKSEEYNTIKKNRKIMTVLTAFAAAFSVLSFIMYMIKKNVPKSYWADPKLWVIFLIAAFFGVISIAGHNTNLRNITKKVKDEHYSKRSEFNSNYLRVKELVFNTDLETRYNLWGVPIMDMLTSNVISYRNAYNKYRELFKNKFPLDYTNDISFEYCSVRGEFGSESIADPCRRKVAELFCVLEISEKYGVNELPVRETALDNYISDSRTHRFEIQYLTHDAAREIAEMLGKLGINAVVNKTSLLLMKGVSVYYSSK